MLGCIVNGVSGKHRNVVLTGLMPQFEQGSVNRLKRLLWVSQIIWTGHA